MLRTQKSCCSTSRCDRSAQRPRAGLFSPPRALASVGRGRGWGLFQHTELSLLNHPPPRLAQGRSPTLPTARKGERGEGVAQLLPFLAASSAAFLSSARAPARTLPRA